MIKPINIIFVFSLIIFLTLKAKKTFSHWLTIKYLLVVRNEENFAEKTTFSFNYAKLIVFATTLVIILFCFCFYLSNTILAKWFNPASREMELNRQLIELSATVDSLAQQLNYRDKTLININHVIKGDDSYLKKGQTQIISTDSVIQNEVDPDNIAPVDMELRKEFESEERSVVRTVSVSHKERTDNLFLFPPVTGGLISEKFNAKINHYGVDVVAKKDEPVKCVADGTVILSSWTNDTGHVIAVQHPGNLISVYKHNSVLLKKVGNLVKAGEIISIIGNSGELTSGPHLHFELWFNSNPVNPEMFVSF